VLCLAIGVILKTIDGFSSFMQFRKNWYVPTRLLVDARDIDSSIDLVVSDMPLSVTSPRVLIFGKDIMNFQELGNYVKVIKAIPIGTEIQIDTNKFRAALPEVTIPETPFEELCSEFTELLYDIREMSGIDVIDDSLTPEEIEYEKAKKIAVILAQRAEEKRQKEEQQRLEAERIKAEERRKQEEEQQAERERIEAEKLEMQRRFEEESARAREEAERQRLEVIHQAELESIKAEAEREKQRIQIELQKKELEAQQEVLKLKQEQDLIKYKQEAMASGTVSFSDTPSSYSNNLKINLTPPRIVGFEQSNNHSSGLKIGGRKTAANIKRNRVFVVSGAVKDAGSSTTAYNLAYSLACNGKTLLIDLDFVDNDLTKWFNVDKISDCSIDMSFRGIPFNNYLNNLDNTVAKISLGKRRLSFISCNQLNNYTPENRAVLRNYNYVPLIRALASRYDNVVVDIGCLSQVEPYQAAFLNCSEFKTYCCYDATSSSVLNESLQNVYNVGGYYTALLTRASRSINRIMIEKAIRRPIRGVIYNSDRYYAGCNYLYEEDETLRDCWSDFIRTGGST
jgi:Mrp family chromosome partitioning ATPase